MESRDVGNKKHTTIVKGLLSFTPHTCIDKVVKFTKTIKEKERKSYRGPIDEYYYYYYYSYSKAAMSCLDKVPQIHKDNQGKKRSIEVPSTSIIIIIIQSSYESVWE